MKLRKNFRKMLTLRNGIAVALVLLLVASLVVAIIVSQNNEVVKVSDLDEQSQEAIDDSDEVQSSTDVPTETQDNAVVVEPVTPGKILNLANWKLALPINTEANGNPDEIKQPNLATYSNENFFFVNSEQTGVVFRANAGGATTSGSSYPRSEMREMTNNGRVEASWSSSDEEHSMTVTQAITALPPVKSEVVAGQIHDANDDVIMIRLEKNHLFVEADGDSIGTLEANYVLGTKFTVTITANSNGIRVLYNDNKTITHDKVGSGYYFKAGCYVQSNTSRGDAPNAYGEVIIYDLKLS